MPTVFTRGRTRSIPPPCRPAFESLPCYSLLHERENVAGAQPPKPPLLPERGLFGWRFIARGGGAFILRPPIFIRSAERVDHGRVVQWIARRRSWIVRHQCRHLSGRGIRRQVRILIEIVVSHDQVPPSLPFRLRPRDRCEGEYCETTRRSPLQFGRCHCAP